MEVPINHTLIDTIEWRKINRITQFTRDEFRENPEKRTQALDIYLNLISRYPEFSESKANTAAAIGFTAADIEAAKCDVLILNNETFVTVYFGHKNLRYLFLGNKELTKEFCRLYIPQTHRFGPPTNEGGRFTVKKGPNHFFDPEIEDLTNPMTQLNREMQTLTTMVIGKPQKKILKGKFHRIKGKHKIETRLITPEDRDVVMNLSFKHSSNFRQMLDNNAPFISTWIDGELTSGAGLIETAHDLPDIGTVGIVGNVRTLDQWTKNGLAGYNISRLALLFFEENPDGFLIADANSLSFHVFKNLGFDPVIDSVWGKIQRKIDQ